MVPRNKSQWQQDKVLKKLIIRLNKNIMLLILQNLSKKFLAVLKEKQI
jgi:hypothetical protein